MTIETVNLSSEDFVSADDALMQLEKLMNKGPHVYPTYNDKGEFLGYFDSLMESRVARINDKAPAFLNNSAEQRIVDLYGPAKGAAFIVKYSTKL